MSVIDSHVETVEELLRGIEGEHKNDKARVQNDLEEVKEALGQMRMEIHSVTNKAAKDGYNAKITQFKARVSAAEKALLFGGSSSNGSGPSASMHAKQQSQEEKQAASLEILKKSRQQLAETQIIAQETAATLSAQTDQIKKQRANMVEVNSNLSHSNKLLNKMSQWWRG